MEQNYAENDCKAVAQPTTLEDCTEGQSPLSGDELVDYIFNVNQDTTLDGRRRCERRYTAFDSYDTHVLVRCTREAKVRVLVKWDDEPHWIETCYVCAPDIEELTSEVNVYTNNSCMGRPSKPEGERRSKLFPLRLTLGEIAELEAAAGQLGVTVAEIFREGAKLYITRRKDGSTKEKKN